MNKPRYRFNLDGSHSLISCGQAHFSQLASGLPSALTGFATRLPYPQTVQSARTFIVSHGLSISELARANNLPRLALQDLLRPNGQLKGIRGQTHRAAVVLGLKPEPGSDAANDATKLPRRKNAAQGAVV